MMRLVSISRRAMPLALAILVAFVLPTTGHGDFFISAFNSTLILTDDLNFYHALSDEPTAVFAKGLSGGPYGPLFYYPTAAWLWVLDTFALIDFDSWSGPSDPTLLSFLEILLLKLPNLVVYALVALTMTRLWRGERGEFSAWLWLANPSVLLFSLMMGQNDAWTALATVAAFLFAHRAVKKQPLVVAGRSLPPAALAIVALAVGAAIKLSPVLLILPFAWLLARDIRGRAGLAALGFGLFALLVAPFLGTEYFWDHGLLGRQTGQRPGLPEWTLPVLYAAYLALVLAVERRGEDRTRALLFAFVALHGLLYVLPGWSPQRAVLFIAVLAVAAPVRRMFLLPYLAVTAVSLVLALEHGNQIAAHLFAVLSNRVFVIPPISSSGEIEPLRSVLLAIGGVAWAAALWSLRASRAPILPSIRWRPAMTVLLIAGLLVYFGATFWRATDGIEATAYTAEAPAVVVAPGQTVSVAFFVTRTDLTAVTFGAETSATAEVRILDGAGRTLYGDRTRLVERGDNRIDVGRIEMSRGQWFVLEVTPESVVRLQASEVPEALVAVVVALDGEPVAGITPRYTLHYETTWRALFGDWRSQLREGWLVMAASGVAVGGTAAGLVAAAGRRRSDGSAPSA